MKHWRPLAEQGNANAQTRLGSLYVYGLGVTQDYTEGARWYRKAAEQGYADAQSTLGFMHANGHGVVQDLVMAYVWSHVAKANGESNRSPKNIQLFAKMLSQTQLKKAQKLSKLCFKKPASCPEFSK